MLRASSSTLLIQQKPRKKLKLQILNDKCYNQFQGNSDQEFQTIPLEQTAVNNLHENKNIKNKQITIEQQIQQNQKIYNLISKDHFKFRRTDQVDKATKRQDKNKQKSILETKQPKKQQTKFQNVKFEQGTQPLPNILPNMNKAKQQQSQKKENNKKQTQKNNKSSTPKNAPQTVSNWQKFLQNKQTQSSKNKYSTKATSQSLSASKNSNPATLSNNHSPFVAIDCQFVKCGQQDHLARISLVNQTGQTLYDSYIKPQKRITDFITQITGITNSHVRNSPLWKDQISKVKKILLGKILVGHTLHKDLEVTGLNKWTGISQKVDISEYMLYKQKGGSKVVSLKRLAASFLNKNIQAGWHSSVQDATVTMDLFKINKKKILKQFKLI